jgi:spoIIIJ-associated protein
MIRSPQAPPVDDAAADFSARTVEEAVALGLGRLGLEPADAEVTVLARGGRGFLGLGSRPARVRIAPRRGAASTVEGLARGVLSRMGIEARIGAVQRGRLVEVRVDAGENDGLLIGRRGETLQALQHLLLRMAGRRLRGEIDVVRVDVAGYRERREEQLRREALDLADRVARTGRRATTDPLLPDERRIVHRALAERAEVRTHAGGSGSMQRVVILPARSGER